jgi:hypothetical protein
MVVRNVGVALCDAYPSGNERQNNIRPPPSRRGVSRPATRQVRWKADNYNNLMEQPTLFYAVTLTLAVLGAGEGLNTGLAWLYVSLRVAHSLIQAIINVVMLRFTIFMAASLVLLVMSVRAALIVY